MVVIVVEIWPQGREDLKKVLARGRIWNRATGTTELGDYEGEFGDASGKVYHVARIKGFERKKRLVWSLLRDCLVAAKVR
jgi:hypothetical protein